MSRLEVGPGIGRAKPKLIFPPKGRPKAKAIALMLHGGDVEDVEPRREWDPSPLPVKVMAQRIQQWNPDLGVVRLLNAVGGWNDRLMSPVVDAQWALMRLRQVYPGLPIAVVGHSMGGRAAFELAEEEGVRALVGLAPWLADGYDEKRFLGVRTMIVHGRADTITNEDASADLVRRIRAAGGSAVYLSVPGWHTLLFRSRRWQREVAGFLQYYLVDHPVG